MQKIELKRSNRKTISVEIRDSRVIVRAPLQMKEKDIYAFVEKKKMWIERHLLIMEERENALSRVTKYTEKELCSLESKAKEYIPAKVEYYSKLIGVSYNKVSIRKQKTIWGSCTSRGNLSFNCLLMEFPEKVIDGVIIHELCHRKHMNHSDAFYREIKKIMPDYKIYQELLKKEGSYYLRKL